MFAKNLLSLFATFSKQIFPDDLKIARVTPVFKGVDRRKLGTIDQCQCFHAFPKTLSVICIITFTNICWKTKFSKI